MSFAKLAGVIAIAAALHADADALAAGLAPRLGIEASGSYGTVTRTSEESGLDVFDATHGGGWSAGATTEWMLGSRWGLVSGLRYVETGEKQDVAITVSGTGSPPLTVRGSIDDRWQWLAVPLHARVTPWAWPLSFEAGPEVQVLMVATSHDRLEGFVGGSYAAAAPAQWAPKGRPESMSTIFEDVGRLDGNVTDRYRRVNYVVGGGVSFAWSMHAGRVIAHARGGFGLNDLMKSDGIERRTRTAEVGAGWQW